jgi:hypothetical protein
VRARATLEGRTSLYVRVELYGALELLEVVDASRIAAFGARVTQGHEHDGGKQPDDRDDYQELDEGEAPWGLCKHALSI